MAKIIQMHLWLHDKAGKWTEPEVINPRSHKPQKGKRIVLEPESDELTRMKIQIAKEVLKWRDRGLRSYYVVLVVQKEDGEIAYRTAIRTTVVA